MQGGDVKSAYKHITVDIDSVNVYPGHYVTVWLNKTGESKERDAVQVELRVVGGKLQIFTELKRVEIKDFDDWTYPTIEEES